LRRDRMRGMAWALTAATLTLGGCVAQGSSPGVVDGSSTDAGECNAETAQTLIGEQATPDTGQRLLTLTGARELRWAPPDSAMTMDFRPDRLTVAYDRQMRIERITCAEQGTGQTSGQSQGQPARAEPQDGRQRIPPLSPFEESAGFTRALRVGDRIIVAGNIGVEADGSISPDAGRQAERCFELILDYVTQLGGQSGDVVRVRMFVTKVEIEAEAVIGAGQ
jgi:enamine deaminase RidA (YjgF/YER057c/UK114 family)